MWLRVLEFVVEVEESDHMMEVASATGPNIAACKGDLDIELL